MSLFIKTTLLISCCLYISTVLDKYLNNFRGDFKTLPPPEQDNKNIFHLKMAASVESLTSAVLAKMGASSVTEIVSTLPSALTTDANISAAEMELKNGRMENAFHQLSLSHSTLLHHRMAQRLHKPSRGSKDEDCSAAISPDSLQTEKATLATTEKDETLSLLQKLPSDWSIIQITSQSVGEFSFRKIGTYPPTPGLYISRCSCGSQPTITVQAVTAPKHEGLRGIVQEVELIKEENKIINKDYRDQQQKYFTKREELNNRLKCVVRSMEIAWLRHWCCLLTGSLGARNQQLLEEATARIIADCKFPLTETQTELLQCIISCPVPPERTGGLELGVAFSMRASVAALLYESVRSARVKDLCALIQKEEGLLGQLRRAQRNPVILVLDKHHSCRSSSVLVQGIDSSKGFYLLDPDSNLPRTQERLRSVFDETGWPGITARRPTHDEFQDAITNQDMFVYAGHGSGSQYLPGELVEGLDCRALVVLYGCASVRLAPRGRISDPWGVVLNYLIAYCPCVVGMLWDVTDKDTDFLTCGMIRALQGKDGDPATPLATPPSDVALLVARSRSLCRWYLTAAALTVYGLPLQVIN
ncbi:separin isoform X2 [Panulirus ornatus]|uniref:separin isoform X2 n=1 Tax=Panulirus ornatus TaxID=150431 RepID=UPI003A85C892